MYINACTNAYVYNHICMLYVLVFIYIAMHDYISKYLCIYTFVHEYVYSYICPGIYIYIYIYHHVCIFTRMYTRVNIY